MSSRATIPSNNAYERWKASVGTIPSTNNFESWKSEKSMLEKTKERCKGRVKELVTSAEKR